MCIVRSLKRTGRGRLRWACVLLLLLSPALAVAELDPEGLVLYLPFEDAENPIDASADPTTAVVEGVLGLADGQFGTQGLEFNGNNANRVRVAHADKLEGMSALTIEAWAYPRNIASYEGMSILSKRNANQDADTYNLFIWTGQILEARVNAGGAVNSTTALQDDTWYHIAYVFDGQGSAGQKTKLYVNGVLENSGDHTATAATGAGGTGAPIWIGELDSARNFPWDGILDEIGIWNIALTEEDINQLMVQSKKKILGGGIASDPQPGDGAEDVLISTDLAWDAGEYAATHNVYFGVSREDVNAADPATLVAEGLAQGTTTLDVGRLDFGQTYYWRVDEVNGAPDFAVLKGDLWSFTAEPLAYPVANIVASSNGISGPGAGPENTVNGSGLDTNDEHSIDASDMWLASSGADPLYLQYDFDRIYKLHEMLVWNYNVQFELLLGFGAKDVTIEYSTDGESWSVLGDVELAQATATSSYQANTMVDFGGAAAQHVRLMVHTSWGGMTQYGLSEVRFLYIPTFARQPQPADGTAGVAPDTTLSWRAGREADVHEVLLGTDPNGLSLVETVADATATSAMLEFGTDYFWRVDEVNEAETPSVWSSDTWSFQTLEYAAIDDFESYDNDENVIFETWIDGWINGTGSTAGYLVEPFAETSIVHSGRQSMPLLYDNSFAPSYSEVERELGGMDLDTNGANTLRLFVAGQAPPFVESPDGTIVMNAIGTDIWNNADQFRYVYKQLNGDGSMIALVEDLDESPDVWVKAGVMIRQDTEAGAINAFVAMTGSGGGGATFQQRVEADGATVSEHTYEGNPFAPPYWIRLERTGSNFSAFISPDGETWQQAGATQTVAMSDPVLIGLALTSHNASVATSAQFSNVSSTGNVTGNWQVAEIGVAQPTTGNDLEPLYVALEDTAGQVAVVTHPNPMLVGMSAWQEWLIPYSDLAGINLNSVDMIYIGIGDRNNPTSGGAGTVFIDDIGFGKPAPVEGE